MLSPIFTEAISMAVYVRNGTYLGMMNTLRQALRHRKNVGVHLVYESGSYYPVNFLRNVALKNAFTKYVFTTDIDFMPSPDLHGKLEHYLKHGTGFNAERRVLIVPAFEQVAWADAFEPYLAFEKEQGPPFNEMFVGRYFNKVTQSLELSVKGFQFIVLPDVYLIHQWHEATPWSDVAYRCSTSTLLALKLQLMAEYGVKLAVKNNMKFSSMFYLPRLPKKR
ncbi:hypothetical protein NP493_1248g02011 [Ridgeia piscesae]|uniref:Uncharacterized protein n=1 Tax=Ridgeia piscesae TaxID=27915 RepID=A0AAD9KC54_RIDPI|nr:hypothetical protein NP493_1248g02011 [Ridgeia piscesae]